MESDLEFEGELLVSRINLIAYRHIYTLEGWLRRICLAAWMSRFGGSWVEELDAKLTKVLESRTRQNRRRLYLGAESHDDLIWSATHAELLQLLAADAVAESIRDLSGADAAFLTVKLDEIREIRNLIAHNRALSHRTHTILAGLLASLEDVVDTFKQRVLYGPSEILGDDGWLEVHLEALLIGNDWSKFQAFVAQRGSFIYYASLPVRPFDRFPDARLLLKAFEDHIDNIVAFCLNKSCNEYIVLTPRVLAAEDHYAICDAFAKNPAVWTNTPFEDQPPRFICSPKIWFYENVGPQRDS